MRFLFLGVLLFCSLVASGRTPAEVKAQLGLAEEALATSFAESMQTLSNAYDKALAKMEVKAREDGDLAEMLAVKAEGKRFRGEMLASENDTAPSAGILTLRKQFSRAVAKAGQEELQKRQELLRRYVMVLDDLTRELTRADRIDEAFAVNDEQKRVEERLKQISATSIAEPPAVTRGEEPTELPEDDGLVARFTFDRTLESSAGEGVVATAYADSKYVTAGLSGQAREFADASSRLRVPPVLTGDVWTISLWAKFESPTAHNSLVSAEGSSWGSSPLWFFTSHGRVALIMNRRDLRYATGQNLRSAFDGATPLAKGRRYHIVCRYQDGVVSLFMDGREDAVYHGVRNSARLRDEPLVIGACGPRDGFKYPFKGTMDDLRFYDHAMTDEQITTLYRNRGR